MAHQSGGDSSHKSHTAGQNVKANELWDNKESWEDTVASVGLPWLWSSEVTLQAVHPPLLLTKVLGPKP